MSIFLQISILIVGVNANDICKDLYEEFTLDNGYNKNLEPPDNLVITDKQKIHDIEEVDDFKQQIVIAMDQQYFWQESRLTINTSHDFWTNGKSSIALSGDFVSKCLWTPEMILTFAQHIDVYNPTPTDLTGSPKKYSLDKDGNIHAWLRNVEIKISCTLDFGSYPFDKQVCHVPEKAMGIKFKREDTNIETKYIQGYVEYQSKKQRELAYIIESVEPLGYLLIPGPKEDKNDYVFPGFAWQILMRRRMSIHVIETFIPTSTMVVVSWFSFLIPPESFPGRVAVLVTLLLVLINCMLKILDYSPVVGSCALSEWTLICLCMVVLALFEYAIIIYFMRFGNNSSKICRSTVPTSKERKLKRKLASLKEKDEFRSSVSDDDVHKTKYVRNVNVPQFHSEMHFGEILNDIEKNSWQWKSKALAIDKFSLKFFPVLFAIVLSIYSYVYLSGYEYPGKYVLPSENLTYVDLEKINAH